ncbi:MAG: hypothetical protein BGO76_02245 [Caedibacter sp. 38-128]|nr:peptidylprolyl isomerase [Holosporales bacterium]OJX08559.1 MAG: hypothetical protein BGO76_02245 [Caedibacter sp. 38-128]
MLSRFMITTAFATFLTFGASAAENVEAVVAKVNGKEVKLKEVRQLEKALPPQVLNSAKDKVKLFTTLRDQLIDIKLITEEAEKAGLDKDPEVQKAIEQAIQQVRVQAYLSKSLKNFVTDSAVKARYDKLVADMPKDEMEVKARHILVKDESAAKKIIEDLKKGADFLKIAREQSIDKASAQEGGDVGYFRKGDMVKEFADASFALVPGKITETPVKTQFGWHVIKVDDKRKVKAPKFEEVQEQLKAAVLEESMLKLVTSLRDKAKIERFNEEGKPEIGDGEKKEEAPAKK